MKHHLTLSRLQQGWNAQTDITYQAGVPANNPLRKVVWTEMHPALDMVISAVAPVYQNGTFKGTVVDMKRASLAENLVQVGAKQDGFAFLLDEHSRLVATNEEGELRLLGQPAAGRRSVLVGVAPEVAQTIVTLGLDLGGLRSAADLRSAVEELLARRHSVRKRVDHP